MILSIKCKIHYHVLWNCFIPTSYTPTLINFITTVIYIEKGRDMDMLLWLADAMPLCAGVQGWLCGTERCQCTGGEMNCESQGLHLMPSRVDPVLINVLDVRYNPRLLCEEMTRYVKKMSPYLRVLCDCSTEMCDPTITTSATPEQPSAVPGVWRDAVFVLTACLALRELDLALFTHGALILSCT